MSAPEGVPEAWPILLNKRQAACLVGLSEGSFDRVCPVAPVDLGLSVLRWNRVQLEAWVASLPSRLRQAKFGEQSDPRDAPSVTLEVERRQSGIERARARAEKACRKRSRTSKGSIAQAVG